MNFCDIFTVHWNAKNNLNYIFNHEKVSPYANNLGNIVRKDNFKKLSYNGIQYQ